MTSLHKAIQTNLAFAIWGLLWVGSIHGQDHYIQELHDAYANAGVLSMNKTCTAGFPSISLTGPEVFNDRYPDMSQLHLPRVCMEEAAEELKRFVREDAANWETLSNRACSYAQGWAERVPGTCQAGGPPPICKVDHWKRDPNAAAAQLEKDKRAIREQRQAQLLKNACSCYLRKLQAEQSAELASSQPPHYARKSSNDQASRPQTPFTSILCENEADCGNAPGFSCREGRCRPLVTSEIVENQVKDKIKDKAMDAATDYLLEPAKEAARKKALQIFGQSAVEIAQSLAGKVAFGVAVGLLEAKDTGTEWKDPYQNTARRIYQEMRQLEPLIEEVQSYRRGGPSRSPDMIFAEVQQLRQKMTSDVGLLGQYKEGIVQQKELGQNCCYGVFEFQHQRLMQSYGNFMALSAFSPDEQ